MPKAQNENLENKYNSLYPDPTSWAKAKSVGNKRVQLLSHQPTASLRHTDKPTLRQQLAIGWYLTFMAKYHYDVTCKRPMTALQNPTVIF